MIFSGIWSQTKEYGMEPFKINRYNFILHMQMSWEFIREVPEQTGTAHTSKEQSLATKAINHLE